MHKQMSLAPRTSHSRQRTTSLILHKKKKSNQFKKNKFKTYSTYDAGYRFYYWQYYRYNDNEIVEYQDIVTDPGNKGYKFKQWYINPLYKVLKTEILEFGKNFGCPIGLNQFKEEYEKAEIHLHSEEGKQLKCNETNWEDKYRLMKGSLISINHLLAIQLYCSFTDAVEKFTETFRKYNDKETDDQLKKRHKKCALWAKYLRECVEGFGFKLKRGMRGVPTQYYRGITKNFLFESTILRFNGVLSTTVTEGIAENFAGNDGLVLTLKPHWGDYPGNIRAWDCSNYSDYPWEREYLFIGGLEPLVIHNLRENKIGGKVYLYEIQTINNICQIFQGMACKFNMLPKLIKRLIDNRLNAKQNDYISQIFNCYCNDVRKIKIRLSLMDKSYQKIINNFIDKYTTKLKLKTIIQLFPNCQNITLYDGWSYQLIPFHTQYTDTILGVIERCIQYINLSKHPLKCICLETNTSIETQLLEHCQKQLQIHGWSCKNVKSEEEEFKYKIYRDV